MAGSASSFYPPRFRWYSPLRYFWFHLGQFAAKFSISTDLIYPALGLGQTLLSILIPGFVFRAFGYRLIGKIAMIYFAIACLVFIVWLGYPVATLAYMGILSLHVTSLSFLLKRVVPNLHIISRMIITLMLLALLSVGVYGRLLNQIEKVFMPLRIGNKLVVVKTCSVKHLHRGDYVAYRLDENFERFAGGNYHGTIRMRGGFSLDRVLAQPGDFVRFSPTNLVVNQQILPREQFMPSDGEFALGENQWFLWPKFAIQGNAPEIEVTKALQSYSIISEKQIFGRPMRRWFWRKQKLP